MKCPADGATLLMTDRRGIEIDYCPECRGVWLDRGELDRLIERADEEPRPSPRPEHYDDDRRYRPPAKKKKSFLSEMFEFGD